MNQGPARIEINEVGPRDGLQIEKTLVSTDDKVAFVDALSDCGFARIEVTSFTSPKAIPALADAVDVMRRISRRPGVIYTALVPNVRGLERALEAGTDEMNLVMSCSETHNRANLRMTRDQSFAELSQVLAAAANAGAPCNVSLSTAFGCPFDGDVPPGTVLDLAARLVDAGAAGITLCDTTGMAFPTQVGALCEQAAARLPATPLTVHLHNTRGMALANAIAAWQTGGGRPGRMSLCAGRQRQRQYRGTGPHVRVHGRADRRVAGTAARYCPQSARPGSARSVQRAVAGGPQAGLACAAGVAGGTVSGRRLIDRPFFSSTCST